MNHYTCFACGGNIIDVHVACPHCGYKVDLDNRKCPNLKGMTCAFTGNPCNNLGSYGKCPIKNKYDREDDF